jgi:hypothetical protein
VTLGPERELSLARGGAALAWDIQLADDCWIGDEGEVGESVWLAAGEAPRVFAIPLRGDVLVAFTWAAGDDPEAGYTQVNQMSDALVQSIVPADGR